MAAAGLAFLVRAWWGDLYVLRGTVIVPRGWFVAAGLVCCVSAVAWHRFMRLAESGF